MVKLPENVARLIRHPSTSKAMATVSPEGEPHMIVCGSLILADDDTIVLGEVYMHRAAEYLLHSRFAEFLVWSGKDGYSIKTKVTGRYTEGPLFDKLSDMLDRMGMTCVAVWTFDALEVWDESASDKAGERVV